MEYKWVFKTKLNEDNIMNCLFNVGRSYYKEVMSHIMAYDITEFSWDCG